MFGGSAGPWYCTVCGKALVLGPDYKMVCPDDCPPPGQVHCPADHKKYNPCPLCKGSNFVEELMP